MQAGLPLCVGFRSFCTAGRNALTCSVCFRQVDEELEIDDSILRALRYTPILILTHQFPGPAPVIESVEAVSPTLPEYLHRCFAIFPARLPPPPLCILLLLQ
jgi:hypothetical protein